MENKHEWNYSSLGGTPRVVISSGADIASLGELDQKKWTVLSCPVGDLGVFDPKTAAYLDTDKDGRIRVAEVVSAAKFLTSVLKDNNLALKGLDTLPLSSVDDSTDEGKAVLSSARQMLSNLGTPEKDSISIAETADSAALFAKSKFNGDGIITAASAEGLEDLVKKIGDCCGTTADRSGEQGIGVDSIEAFYSACSDFDAWTAAGEKDESTHPFGADTASACAALDAISAKADDYFMRCKLISFDPATAEAVDVPVAKLAEISTGNLSEKGSEIGSYPLARPSAAGTLPYDGINPAWQGAFAALRSTVLDKLFPGTASLNEAKWNEAKAKFGSYRTWLGAKKGAAVEGLGIEEVRKVLKEDKKQALLDLVAKDKALEAEYNGIESVTKTLYLLRDFCKFLNNYVIFKDFYSRATGSRGLFEAGRLFIDQRCCELCLKVSDMSKHADMAKLSGMFLIYCKCTSKDGKTMDIVAVMTDGETADLRPGKNGIFYDSKGEDWDATITNVVDNPVSISQAFWSPYRKFGNFVSGIFNKSAADKESKMTANLQNVAGKVTTAPAAAAAAPAGTPEAAAVKKPGFNIAEFAGIFAALGMALGYIGSFFVNLAKGVASTPWWEVILIVVAIMLLISGPSCFLAWMKLRRRNLGPVLNANGWAINSRVLVDIPFGGLLTSVAKYPKIQLTDSVTGRKKGTPAWKVLLWIILLLALVLLFLYVKKRFNF